MTKSLASAAFLFIGFASVAAPALACSVAGGYDLPSNYEMVEKAPTILLGKAVSMTGDEWGGEITVKPIRLLKGTNLPEQVKIYGSFGSEKHPVRPSDPNELERAHPSTYDGMCTRQRYVKGSTLLLFLADTDDGPRVTGYPFARNAEDVPGDNALWVRTVERYVDVVSLPENQRRAALIAHRDELRAAGDRDSLAMAADIDRHLEKKKS